MARKLATLEIVTQVAPIENSDNLEKVRVRGWDVVAKKGEFNPGDWAIYFEIDSLIPTSDPRFAFLAARGEREDAEGNRGHVLKTVKLRGQVSQGLVMPTEDFHEAHGLPVGADLTEFLGVRLWEPPVPASLSGQVKGMRPVWIPKTDEDRIQNHPEYLKMVNAGWFCTEKIDGSSMSVYMDTLSEHMWFGVCSRNLDILWSENNTMWAVTKRMGLHTLIADLFPDSHRVVLQGEIYGEGIQSNPLKVRGQHFALFGIIADGIRLHRRQWPEALMSISVPEYRKLSFPSTVDEAIAQVDGINSLINAERKAEGVVWSSWSDDGYRSFKVISNKYLLKNDR